MARSRIERVADALPWVRTGNLNASRYACCGDANKHTVPAGVGLVRRSGGSQDACSASNNNPSCYTTTTILCPGFHQHAERTFRTRRNRDGAAGQRKILYPSKEEQFWICITTNLTFSHLSMHDCPNKCPHKRVQILHEKKKGCSSKWEGENMYVDL